MFLFISFLLMLFIFYKFVLMYKIKYKIKIMSLIFSFIFIFNIFVNLSLVKVYAYNSIDNNSIYLEIDDEFNKDSINMFYDDLKDLKSKNGDNLGSNEDSSNIAKNIKNLIQSDSDISEEDLDDLLYKSGINISMNKDVNESYNPDNESSSKVNVVLKGEEYYKINSDLMSIFGADIDNYIGNLGNIYPCIYFKEMEGGSLKVCLRIYNFRTISLLGTVDTTFNVAVVDYDITDTISNLYSNFYGNWNDVPLKDISILNDYPRVKVLLESYDNFNTSASVNKLNKQKEVFDWYDKKSFTGYNGGELSNYIKKWNKFILSSNDSVPSVDNPEEISKVDIATLTIYFRILAESGILNVTQDKMLNGYYFTEDTVLPAFDSSNSNSNSKVYDILTLVSNANSVVDKYKTKSPAYSTKSIEGNAFMFFDLIKYRYGVLSGAEEMGLDTSSSDKIIKLSSLDNLLYTFTDLSGEVINPALWEQIPNMNMFSVDVNAKDFMNMMSSVQMLEYYASTENSSSGLSKDDINISDLESNIKNELLEECIAEKEQEAKDNDTDKWTELTEPELIRQVITYKSIKEGLDYIGIRPWTPALKYIYDMYDTINRFELSEDFSEYVDDDSEPLQRFFNMKDKSLSTNYLTGVALSSTYIPMQTNLYDYTSVKVLKNTDWLSQFHIKYGFNRKALMIDTNINAAVDNYITGKIGNLRVATLRDLLECEKDIVLYIDDNFYNTDDISEALNKAYTRLANTEQAGISNEEGTTEQFVSDLFNESVEEILKTGPVSSYSESLIDDTAQYGKDESISWQSLKENIFTEGLILSSNDNSENGNKIKEYLDEEDYSVMQSYAVVSGIYRHKDLSNLLNKISDNPKPVFISSPKLFNIQGISEYEFNTIFNYYMLKNLSNSFSSDYNITLDLDNPLFIDIYGNIITESGLVVIPAASNSTLYPGDNYYSPYTIGFMYLYSKGNNIVNKNDSWFYETDSEKEAEENGSINPYDLYLNDFIYDDENKVYLQKNYTFNDIPVNPQNPSISDSGLLETLYDNQVSILNKKGYDFEQRVWLITEVLRGAPIENIDKEKEGIGYKRDINKYGLYMSWKLDDIADSILPTTNGNSLISMPNLAFLPGIEYIILFFFKIMILVFILYIIYKVYIDAVSGLFGIRTFASCMATILVFSVSIGLLPSVISLSYNEPQKYLLQSEVGYLNLLNLEKNLEGREISAVGVEEPKSQTELYLKLDSIKIPWYKLIGSIMFSDIDKSISELYKEELQDHILYGYTDVEVYNNGVYINLDNLFDSSDIVYNTNNHFIYQYMNRIPTASYFTPYYYFLDTIIDNINIYNSENNNRTVTTKIQSDGSVKTIGMINEYLCSSDFLEDDLDPLLLYSMYNISTGLSSSRSPDSSDISTIESSMWYVKDNYSDESISSKIDELYTYMRSYISKNKDMLGKVTDETFLKCFALDIATKYNDLFNVPSAKNIEVFGIDSRDIIRLSISDSSDIGINSSYSFGRFIYEVSGGLGVILTSILMGVYFISSIVKPLIVLILICILIFNILFKHMLKLEKTKTFEGLLYLLAIMVVINSVYALCIKLCMFMPDFGLNPTISIIGQIVIQVLYLIFSIYVLSNVFKDIFNFGYNRFNTLALGLIDNIRNISSSFTDRFEYTEEQKYYMDISKSKSNSYDDYKTLKEEMYDRDKRRDSSIESENEFLDDLFSRRRDK